MANTKLEFEFLPASESYKLENETRALVRHADGYLEFAIWYSDDQTWYEEGSIQNCGGIGGNITKDVVEFSIDNSY